MSLKQSIIAAFAKMDIEQLDTLLSDKQTYQDATKQVFLNKVLQLFLDYRANGDEELTVHDGHCTSCNRGCAGFCFIGNHTRNYTTLLIEGTDEQVTDIHHCSAFETLDLIKVRNTQLEIKILYNERASFNPSPKYVRNVRLAENACLQLLQSVTIVSPKDEYLQWLQDNETLYYFTNKLHILDDSFKLFRQLYQELDNLAAYLKYTANCIEALADFVQLSFDGDEAILAWLLKYEWLGNKLVCFLVDYFDNDNDTPYLKVLEDKNLYILLSDYQSLHDFATIYNDHHTEMLEKYHTDPDYEHDFTEYNDWGSLRFHLQQRGMIME